MIKKILINKNKGNITSLIISQLFLFVLLIWCLFNFRLLMLNTTFNYIDDALVSSLLGSALVNVEEYGKSNQLIIHNGDYYENKSGNTTTNGWDANEAAILVSELNYGSDITLSATDLDYKKVLSDDSWQYSTKNRHEMNLQHFSLDDYYKRAISALIGNINYNLSNGNYSGNINVTNTVNNVQADLAIADPSNPTGPMVIPSDVLGKSFLNSYIDGDITISRLEIYNVYHATLADRHVYNSNYMDYYIGSNIQDGPNNYATSIEWKVTEPRTEDQFEKKYKPCEYILKDNFVRTINTNITTNDYKQDSNGNYIENESYAAEMEVYNRDKLRWQKDLDYYNSGNQLWMYTDTETTYLGEYTPDKVHFKYFYENDGYTAREIVNGEKAPIDRWSKYSFTPSTGGTLTISPSSGNITENLKITDGKLAGMQIENTSVYVELTFKVKTFPIMTGVGIDTLAGNSKTVTVSRLIDIEIN